MTETTCTCPSACDALIEKAKQDNVETAFVRSETMKPCPIGAQGACCKHCDMGPCRVLTKEGAEEKHGVCGAGRDTIAARNFCRMIAAGNSAHIEHARDIVHTFLGMATGELSDYTIKDEKKLHMMAEIFEIPTDGVDKMEIARQLGEKALAEFGQQKGSLHLLTRAPKKRRELWDKLGISPRGIDREIVDLMHRTTIGTDMDPDSLLLQGSRAALANGWGASMIATELQDIMFGTPTPVRGKMNMGVLEEKQVNLIVHGHDPLLAEMVVVAAQEPELLELAKSKGAEGINIGGICCTANELLQRHGIPMVGSFSQQELAIITGAVEVMVLVTAQCSQMFPHQDYHHLSQGQNSRGYPHGNARGKRPGHRPRDCQDGD